MPILLLGEGDFFATEVLMLVSDLPANDRKDFVLCFRSGLKRYLLEDFMIISFVFFGSFFTTRS